MFRLILSGFIAHENVVYQGRNTNQRRKGIFVSIFFFIKKQQIDSIEQTKLPIWIEPLTFLSISDPDDYGNVWLNCAHSCQWKQQQLFIFTDRETTWPLEYLKGRMDFVYRFFLFSASFRRRNAHKKISYAFQQIQDTSVTPNVWLISHTLRATF